MTTCVWIRLYIGGDKSGEAFGVYDSSGKNVDQLKKAVKKERSNDLRRCDAAHLAVYKPGTTVPVEEGTKSLPPSAAVPTDTTDENPLVVVAPPPPPQHQVSFFFYYALGFFSFELLLYRISQRLTFILHVRGCLFVTIATRGIVAVGGTRGPEGSEKSSELLGDTIS